MIINIYKYKKICIFQYMNNYECVIALEILFKCKCKCKCVCLCHLSI